MKSWRNEGPFDIISNCLALLQELAQCQIGCKVVLELLLLLLLLIIMSDIPPLWVVITIKHKT